MDGIWTIKTGLNLETRKICMYSWQKQLISSAVLLALRSHTQLRTNRTPELFIHKMQHKVNAKFKYREVAP